MTKVAIVAALVLMTGCIGNPGGEPASNDSSAMATGQFAVETADQLPDCDETTEAYIAFVRDAGHTVQCKRGAWTANSSIN